MATQSTIKHLENEVNKGIDDVMETLKWVKRHRHERKAIDALRLTQMNLGYLALAMDWEMEGDPAKAQRALYKAWWQPHQDGVEQAHIPAH